MGSNLAQNVAANALGGVASSLVTDHLPSMVARRIDPAATAGTTLLRKFEEERNSSAGYLNTILQDATDTAGGADARGGSPVKEIINARTMLATESHTKEFSKKVTVRTTTEVIIVDGIHASDPVVTSTTEKRTIGELICLLLCQENSNSNEVVRELREDACQKRLKRSSERLKDKLTLAIQTKAGPEELAALYREAVQLEAAHRQGRASRVHKTTEYEVIQVDEDKCSRTG